MAFLPETDGATYPTPRQIENGEAQAGGPDGLWNEHAKAMVERTNWLKTALAGMGGNAVVVNNLDTIDRTCVFFADANAIGIPAPARDYRGLHITSQDGTEHSQIVVGLTHYLAFRDYDAAGGGWGPWREILHDGSGSVKSYYTTDAPDGWIIGENIKGDTSVALNLVTARCHRLGKLAHVSLQLDVAGFSVPASNDVSVSLSFDINALAVAAGWFASITSDAIEIATLEFSGEGWDAPSLPIIAGAQSGSGTIYFGTNDTTGIPAQATNADSMRIRTSFTVLVED